MLTRRSLLASSTAAIAASALPTTALASQTGQRMIDRANRWLAQLNDDQRATALFRFDSDTRRGWNYMLGSRAAPGLPLEQMSAPQKEAALDVLASGLSDYGLETAMNIMLQQDILRDELGKGSPDRNRERFSLMIFGAPSASDPWGWRWEGHHLTISYTLIGDQVVAQTPKSFSSEPNTVPSGPHEGLVVLEENEALGRALYGNLTGASQRQALLNERSFGNVQATAGRETGLGAPNGLALGDMTQDQADIAERLIALYTTDHLARPIAQAQASRLQDEDLSAVRFGWAGANLDGNSIYYRLHGQTFLIEFATLRNQPQHQHTIVHDLQRNLGAHVL